MKIAERQKYNELINKLNNGSGQDIKKDITELDKWYSSILCHFPSYEEIVILLNICIALDRDSTKNYEKLYDYYTKIDAILYHHAPVGLYNAYILYYCVGVFAFKFHDYNHAYFYFHKCTVDILKKDKELKQFDLSVYYVRAKVLMSYSLEYKSRTDGPMDAIQNLLDNTNVNLDFMNSPEQTISSELFFQKNNSRVYSMADNIMKKEIVHVLAHCFSEHSVYLKTKLSKSPEEVYMWEHLSEIFIKELGTNMATCQATILAEHGHYHDAISCLDKYIKTFDNPSGLDSNKYAEAAFYLYYFNNRIGIENDDINKYKESFLNFANKAENKDTQLYAWITEFRAEFGKNVNMLKEKHSVLENLIKKGKENIQLHSYVHPQIKNEQMRLILAFQIIYSYSQNANPDAMDSGLFEKCVLFNSLNSIESVLNSTNKKWDPAKENLVSLLGKSLCVYGMSDTVAEDLYKNLGVEVFTSPRNDEGRQKILVIKDQESFECVQNYLMQRKTYEERYYAAVPNDDIRRDVELWCEDNDIECYTFTEIDYTFKVAYIQETLENCFYCAYRWNEYFIMAPITDNETFSFQSQVIDSYIKMNTGDDGEKKLFSNENGYDTQDFDRPRAITNLMFNIDSQKYPENSRMYFYCKDWIYEYDYSNKRLLPRTLCENTRYVKKMYSKLGRKKKNDQQLEKCRCSIEGHKQCFCNSYDLNVDKHRQIIDNMLMALSLERSNKNKDSWCTTFYSRNNTNILNPFMIILSDSEILSGDLRLIFDNLESQMVESKNMDGFLKAQNENLENNDNHSGDNDKNLQNDIGKLKETIQEQLEAKDNISNSDKEECENLINKLKSCKSKETFLQIKKQWDILKKGG